MRAAGVVTLLLMSAAVPAKAGEVSVNPVRLKLAGDGRSGLFMVTNRSQESARYEVSAFAWQQDESTAPTLQPTHEVVFHPQLFELKPGEARAVRFGVSNPSGDRELAYRMIVEELPPPDATPSTGLRVLQRLSLPLFVAPKTEARSARLTLEREQVALSSTGNVHLEPGTVEARALGANGETLFNASWKSWYVLSDGARHFPFALPPAICASVKSIELTAAAGDLSLRESVPAPGCAN